MMTGNRTPVRMAVLPIVLSVVVVIARQCLLNLYKRKTHGRTLAANKLPQDVASPATKSLAACEKKEWDLFKDVVEAQLAVMDAKHDDSSYENSREALSEVSKLGLVVPSDLLRKNMAKVFFLHRRMATCVEGGMGIRYTVHYNLFSGSVMNIGNEAQQEQLAGILSRGELGCFALTEKGAGVLSGLIVETTAIYNPLTASYTINSPTENSVKTWISGGLTSKWAVVIAKLVLPKGPNGSVQSKGKKPFEADPENFDDFGPHAFLVDLDNNRVTVHRGETESKAPKDGTITCADMSEKTAFNALDNCTIRFTNVVVPGSSLLSGISHINEAGEYFHHDAANPFRFEIVAQRLLSGRICIAGASLGYLQTVIDSVRKYKRNFPTGKTTTTPLVEIPAIKACLDDAQRARDFLLAYVLYLERRYQESPTLTPKLVEEIACAKIVCVEAAVECVKIIKGVVGSYSLMSESPFGTKSDCLYVYRFAEGDTGILVQKTARDYLGRNTSNPIKLIGHIFSALMSPVEESRGLSSTLVSLFATMAIGGGSPAKTMALWLKSHRKVLRLGWMIALETIREAVLREFPGMRGSDELAAYDGLAKVLLQQRNL